MSDIKILAFSGSARANSFNQALVSVAADAARDAGADVTLINLADYPCPIFNEDFEKVNGHPDEVKKLKELFLEHHGLLISCPEYNSSVTPLLKNTIDWVSRPVEGQPPLACYIDKVAGLMAASPGALGGLRGLVHVRSILQNIGVTVVPKQMAISQAHDAFDDAGKLKNEKNFELIKSVAASLVRHTRAVQHCD